jgi:hypothetical protein
MSSVVEEPTGGRSRRWAPRRTRVPVLLCAGLTVVVAAGAGGWFLNDASHGANARDVTVSDTFTGMVTALNLAGTSGCVQPSDGARSVCSVFATFGHHLHIGETVHAAYEVYRNERGNGYYLLLIVPTSPPG